MKKYADSQTDSLLDVMAQNGIKLPTPKAIIKHCQKTGLSRSETLFGEINDLYNSLNFYQQQKYFTSRYSDIDDIANVLRSEHNFPYEGSADFLSDFADNIWGRKETRFSAVDNFPERLKKLRESKPIKINSKDVKIRLGADLKTRKEDAYNIGMTLRGVYYNKDTGDGINVVEKSISELLRHDVDFKKKENIVNVSFAHLLSVAKIPEIIEKSIYINSIPNEDTKNDGKIESFDYYLVGLKIDGKDYTAKVVVAKNSNGQKFYDHALSKIEKGKLLWHLIKSLSRGSDTSRNLPSEIRDKRIFSLLQENNSDGGRFSAIDSDFEARKRRAAVLLAEKLYNQAGQNYNPENGNSEAFNPTEEQLQDVYMSEMDFLDEDVDEIVNQAMAIAYKMASRGGNIKNIREGQRKDSGLGKRKTLSNALSERVS